MAIGKNEDFGFNIVWRYQSTFVWESPLAKSDIPAYHSVDAPVNYRISKKHANVKLGGSNIFNNRYIQYAAEPTIGGLYYAAITVEGLLNK